METRLYFSAVHCNCIKNIKHGGLREPRPFAFSYLLPFCFLLPFFFFICVLLFCLCCAFLFAFSIFYLRFLFFFYLRFLFSFAFSIFYLHFLFFLFAFSFFHLCFLSFYLRFLLIIRIFFFLFAVSFLFVFEPSGPPYIYHVKFTSYCELIECSRPIRFFIVSLMYNNSMISVETILLKIYIPRIKKNLSQWSV